MSAPTKAGRITYQRLTPVAKLEIQAHGFTVAEYVRAYFQDGDWRGDRCGCTDDRCRDGYHHEPYEDCGCLAAMLRWRIEKGTWL